MKWLKFAKEYKAGDVVQKAGAIAEFDDSIADTLVNTGYATIDKKPDAAENATAGLSESIKSYLDAAIGTAIAPVAKEVVKEISLQFANGKGSYRKPRIETHDNAEDDPTLGFKSIGEQCQMIAKWCRPESRPAVEGDERMKRLLAASTKAPTTYANEGLGPDGGFLLAPSFANTVLMHDFFDESLLAKTDKYETASNNQTIPKDETTPWGTSGIQAYWAGEATQLTQSKIKVGQDNLVLHKLTVLVPVTNEQLDDTFVGLGQYVGRQASQRIMWKCDDAIVNGTGAGQPLGFLNSGALVSQAKETAQTAATINFTNVSKMLGHMPLENGTNLAWLAHPSALPQLMTMTNGNNSLWIASGEVESKGPRLGRFLGLPLYVSQHCQGVGTQGDIYLVDFSKYLSLTKGDGVQTAMSMHLFFDYDVSAFRFIFRMAGQPWLQNAITSAYGSYSMSPFVTLDTRS